MTRFAKYAWLVLAYNLTVVGWGAYVRASGSGAGCGSHWPLCQGEVVPRSPQVATLIELSHRVSSGLALVLVVNLFLWSRRAAPRGSPVRLGGALSLGFMLGEVLLGAGLVLFKLVALDASLTRVVSLGAHLLNTFLLLGSIGLTAWWASGGAPVDFRSRAAVPWMFALGLAGTLLVGMSGAIAALGDTLFPSSSLAEGLRQDASPTAHLLIRLRVLHPALAIVAGFYLIGLALFGAVRLQDSATVRWARALATLVLLQWTAGVLNLLLLAPIWLQLGHLLLADLVWIALVLMAASALARTGVADGEPSRLSAPWDRATTGPAQPRGSPTR